MSMHDRAAQFSPFAALTGYDDCVAEAGRLTASKRITDDDTGDELDRKIAFLSENIRFHPEVTVLYFVKDERKEGGRYARMTGNLKRIDFTGRNIIFTDGTVIALSDISELEAKIFGNF